MGMRGKDKLEIVSEADRTEVSGGRVNESGVIAGAGDGNDNDGSLIVTGSDSNAVGMSGSNELVSNLVSDNDEAEIIGRNDSDVTAETSGDEAELRGEE